MNTTDSILEALQNMAEQKVPISPHTWLEATSKLIALIGNEQNRLFELEHIIAKIKSEEMERGETAAKAKVIAESRTEHLEARKLKAKIDRVFEMIKLGKIHARMALEDFKAQV